MKIISVLVFILFVDFATPGLLDFPKPGMLDFAKPGLTELKNIFLPKKQEQNSVADDEMLKENTNVVVEIDNSIIDLMPRQFDNSMQILGDDTINGLVSFLKPIAANVIKLVLKIIEIIRKVIEIVFNLLKNLTRTNSDETKAGGSKRKRSTEALILSLLSSKNLWTQIQNIIPSLLNVLQYLRKYLNQLLFLIP